MSIKNVVLFVSTSSTACVAPTKFIFDNSLPVIIVRLDTQEDRNRVLNGKYFKVEYVPTLFVLYDDGNSQVFEGAQKAIGWLKSAIPQAPGGSSGDYQEEEYVSPPPNRSTSKGSSKKKVADPPTAEIEEDDEELLEDPSPPKKKKKKIVRFDDEDEEEEDTHRASRKKNPVNIGVPEKANKSKSIMELAEEMKKERSATLGYDDKL